VLGPVTYHQVGLAAFSLYTLALRFWPPATPAVLL
jgi:hypothetical protein